MEDYTSKYKGETIELALFGGEYQDGVLTAYCYIEDVPHIELNGHILVPLQNVASLHCTSRCDAGDDHWPPRGLVDDEPPNTDRSLARAWLSSSRGAPAVASVPGTCLAPTQTEGRPLTGTALVESNPAATYSPRRSRTKYHRRREA